MHGGSPHHAGGLLALVPRGAAAPRLVPRQLEVDHPAPGGQLCEGLHGLEQDEGEPQLAGGEQKRQLCVEWAGAGGKRSSGVKEGMAGAVEQASGVFG